MTKRQSAIAASVQKATRGNAAFVFASSADTLPQTSEAMTQKLTSAKYSKFGCTACGTATHSRADTTPFCITCGAGEGHVHQIEADVKPAVTANTELVAMTCGLCNSSTVVESVVANAITAANGKHPIHCSCCGNPMIAEAAEQDGESAKMGVDNVSDQTLTTPEPGVVKADMDPDVSDADGDIDLSMESDGGYDFGAEDGDLDLENLDGGDDDIDATDEFGIADEAPVEGDSTLVTPGAPVLTESFDSPQPADEPGMDSFSLELEPVLDEAPMVPVADITETPDAGDFEESLVLSNEDVGDPLVDALDMDDTEQAVAFVRANGRLVVMKGHVAIASMSAKSKSPNSKLLHSNALPEATLASINQEGLRAGLRSVGFSLVKVPVSTVAKAAVERRVQEVQAKAAVSDTQKQKAFADSFALAAAGLNRGQWKGVTNPLRASMETELARAGVEQPRRVVASIFNAAGLEYAETLLATTNRLTKMSAGARKELSEVLNMTSAVSPAEEHDDMADDLDSTPVESRFSKAGVNATAALLRPRHNAVAGATGGAAAVLSGAAELNFSF